MAGGDSTVERWVKLIAEDPARWELERPAALEQPERLRTLATRLVERVLEEEERARAADARDDSIGRERARTQHARCFGALLQLGMAGAAQCIREASGGGPRVALALDVLGRMPDADVKEPVGAALDEADPKLRRAALRVLAASTPRAIAFEERVAQLLHDDDWRVRREAAVVLGKSVPQWSAATPKPWLHAEPMVALLADPNWLVACEAAKAVGRRREFELLTPLVDFLERAKRAGDPSAIVAAHSALRDGSSGADLAPEPSQWRRWLEQNQPIAPRKTASAPTTPLETKPTDR